MVIYFPGGSKVWSAYASIQALSRVQANGLDGGLTSSYDRTKHDRLVRLVLEVGLPDFVELRAHFLQLSFRWADLRREVSEGPRLTQDSSP